MLFYRSLLLSLFNVKNRIFYGWIVTIAGFLLLLISLGMRYSFGVVFKSLEGEFVLSRGATSTIFSVYMLLCCVFAVLGGWALDRYGPRIITALLGFSTGLSLLLTSQTSSAWQLYITYGLLLSLGTGAIFTVVNSTVSRWFNKKRGFTLGIATAGGSAGTVVLAPFTTYLISDFGWRMAFVILGFCAWLIMISLSMLLKKDPVDMGLFPDGVRPGLKNVTQLTDGRSDQLSGISLREASRTSNYWFLFFSHLLLALSVHLITTHIVPHAIDLGISAADAAIILGLIGLSAILGRILTGRVSDSIGRKAPAIACALFQAGILTWLIWMTDLWMLCVFATVFGFTWGGLGTQLVAQIGDIFGVRSIGAIMGTVLVGWYFGAAIGPALGGFMFDASGSYFAAFITAAACMLIAAVITALIIKK